MPSRVAAKRRSSQDSLGARCHTKDRTGAGKKRWRMGDIANEEEDDDDSDEAFVFATTDPTESPRLLATAAVPCAMFHRLMHSES